MSYKLSIRKEAEADMKEGFEYYESCRENLGHDFLLCAEETFSQIVKFPHRYKVIHRTVRRSLVRRFPYGVYFVVKDNTVSVIAVMHARKRPRQWQQRA